MKRKNENAPYWVMLRQQDKMICEWALEQTGGNARAAASLLGINTGYMYQKIKDLDIDLKQFKRPKKSTETAEGVAHDEAAAQP